MVLGRRRANVARQLQRRQHSHGCPTCQSVVTLPFACFGCHSLATMSPACTTQYTILLYHYCSPFFL